MHQLLEVAQGDRRAQANLRFDDTNPVAKEDTEFVEAILRGHPLAGVRLGRATLLFTSDYFEELYRLVRHAS